MLDAAHLPTDFIGALGHRFCSDVPGVFPDALRLPFIEGVPNREKAADLRRWLLAHRDKDASEAVVLYHSTGGRIPLLEQGLKLTTVTRRRSFQSQSGYCYLAATPERALNFGRLGNGSGARVYAVRVPIRDLKADLDQLRNQRAAEHDVGSSLEESILWGGGARVKRAIAPSDLAEVFLGPDGRFQAIAPPAVVAARALDARSLVERMARTRKHRTVSSIG